MRSSPRGADAAGADRRSETAYSAKRLPCLPVERDCERRWGMKEEPKMNYCCDCEYAVKKGLFRKTWYCTCPELNWPYPVRDSVTGEPALNFGEMIPSKIVLMPGSIPLMPSFKTCEMARFYEHEEPCPYFKLKGFAPPRKNPLPCPPLPERTPVHPFVPPKTTPYHEAPPRPERVVKTMEKEKLRKFDPMIDEDSPAPEVWTKAVCDDKSCIYRSGLGCDRKWIFITEGGKCGKRMTLDKYKEYMGIKNEKKTKGANK